MNFFSTPTYTATITIGSEYGYTKQTYDKKTLIKFLQKHQIRKIKEDAIYLSACISECEIVMSGQIEPHYQLSFINYPKFPLDENTFKEEVEVLTQYLMKKLKQNRVVILYQNETKMFELNQQIDPRI